MAIPINAVPINKLVLGERYLLIRRDTPNIKHVGTFFEASIVNDKIVSAWFNEIQNSPRPMVVVDDSWDFFPYDPPVGGRRSRKHKKSRRGRRSTHRRRR